MARLLRGYAQVGLENVALWHERDISHSSAERVVLPDACLALDYMLARFTALIEGLVVNTDRMLANLEATRGLVCSQAVLLALVGDGMTRDEAYRVVQENAMKAWETERPVARSPGRRSPGGSVGISTRSMLRPGHISGQYRSRVRTSRQSGHRRFGDLPTRRPDDPRLPGKTMTEPFMAASHNDVLHLLDPGGDSSGRCPRVGRGLPAAQAAFGRGRDHGGGPAGSLRSRRAGAGRCPLDHSPDSDPGLSPGGHRPDRGDAPARHHRLRDRPGPGPPQSQNRYGGGGGRAAGPIRQRSRPRLLVSVGPTRGPGPAAPSSPCSSPPPCRSRPFRCSPRSCSTCA